MIEDVPNYIRTCERCTRYKQPPEREKLKPIHCTYPLELVHIDFLTIGKEGTDKATNIMVITNHCTSSGKDPLGSAFSALKVADKNPD